jgi:hypothetical protein
MKRFILFMILIQVGSKLWVNPKQVVGIEDNTVTNSDGTTYILTEARTIILFPSGGATAYRYSDWDFDKVKKALTDEPVSKF